MSVQSIPYLSLRDIVVATTEGYAIRFVAGQPVDVPNYKNVIQAVQSAGCMPVEEVGARVVATKTKTIEEVSDAEAASRADAIQLAISAIVDGGQPIDFNRAGAPQTRSLEKLTGFEKISNAERDKAWKTYQENKEG